MGRQFRIADCGLRIFTSLSFVGSPGPAKLRIAWGPGEIVATSESHGVNIQHRARRVML